MSLPPTMLMQGLELYFTSYDEGMLTSCGLSLAFWRRDGFYYLFDSHSRNKDGQSTLLFS